MAAVVLLGLLIRFVPWKPAELSPAAWTLFSIFVSMMFGLIIEPLPTGTGSIDSPPSSTPPTQSITHPTTARLTSSLDAFCPNLSSQTGALCLVAATVALMTKSVSFPDMFTFFSRGSTWLIVGSFFFAKGYAITVRPPCGLRPPNRGPIGLFDNRIFEIFQL
jgi:hypothetical protein